MSTLDEQLSTGYPAQMAPPKRDESLNAKLDGRLTTLLRSWASRNKSVTWMQGELFKRTGETVSAGTVRRMLDDRCIELQPREDAQP